MQHTSMSPDRRLISVVGDHTDGLVVDSQSGKVKEVVLLSNWDCFSSFSNFRSINTCG